jgi:F0F1-type ATP synthase assembly protein I
MISIPSPPTDKSPADPDPERENSSGKENFWVQAARYSQLAFIFPAALVAGWLVGVTLDRWLHTTWLYLAGILLGIAAGFIELIRVVLRDTK